MFLSESEFDTYHFQCVGKGAVRDCLHIGIDWTCMARLALDVTDGKLEAAGRKSLETIMSRPMARSLFCPKCTISAHITAVLLVIEAEMTNSD